MKKLLSFVLSLCFLFSLLVPASAAGTRFRVTVRSRIVRNDHVGNEWSLYHYIDDEEIFVWQDTAGTTATDTVTLPDSFTLLTYVEDGEKYPDSAEEETYITLSRSDRLYGFTVTVQLIVTEDKGRYKGNTCRWEVIYDFEPQ